MDRFTPIRLTDWFNAPGQLQLDPWDAAVEKLVSHLPRGRQTCWGIPFVLGPRDLSRDGLILLTEDSPEVEVPLRGKATHVCVLHFCNAPADAWANAAGGEHVADYELRFGDGTTHVQAIRDRFEIGAFTGRWGASPFAALQARMPRPAQESDRIAWGNLQTGVIGGGSPFSTWVYAVEHPYPDQALKSIVFRPRSPEPVAILGVTLYNGPGHPLRHVPRRVYKLILPPGTKATADRVDAQLDMGVVTRVYAVPDHVDEGWLDAVERGLGAPRHGEPGREFLVEATGAEGATLTVKVGRGKERRIPFGEAFRKGEARSPDRQVRIELLHPRSTWVHVTVMDGSTGKPTPTRIHFRGRNGEYIPPYGHHAAVNDRWFEDYGGDLQLGGMSYAYVPGTFQIELPVGEVYVELSKGFEYAPVRRKLEVQPGQRELTIQIDRRTDLRREGWVTADTHVHFISPQTAWLEGQGEGLNLINLLASQWGRLFTNVADITGELSGCSEDDTLVWVGTENRNHLLGHISMLGTHGDPVFPMCTGGPGEAYLGDPDMTTLTEWAQTCREREGVVIRPHFPSPVCEEPVYFILGQLDGAELRRYAHPDAETLDEFCFKEWYRYLNCGYRVAAVGGTDKMSAGMPVGGARTYAKLSPDDPFTLENWGKAVRAGRTFTTSGPLMELTVDGHAIGEEIQMPSGGGTVEVWAKASCIWPIHRLEVVVNGQVVASTASEEGATTLSLREAVRLTGSGWIAARCGSRLQVHHCWPIQLGAHTSPVYVVAGGEELFSPSDASYMLTLIDGGLTYLNTLSVRYSEERHRQLKAVFERARRVLHERMHTHGHGH